MKPPPTDVSAEFIQLLTTHQSRLYAYALSLLGNRESAKEVMQETNIIMWRKAEQFKLGTNFGAWMMKIAYYQSLEFRRKQNRQAVFIEDEEFLSTLAVEAADSTDTLEQQQMALQRCLERLPDRQRDLVRRRYTEGASIKLVAEQIGIAASAVKQTLFRARSKLIECVRFRLKEQNA
ncbi:MAG: RNA polymerase subunit sigma-70 [Opitutales bacterium TMED158]|nr:MAG: RNA polymerase subunit sigma-70 [Opitutales bacterium TMED158]